MINVVTQNVTVKVMNVYNFAIIFYYFIPYISPEDPELYLTKNATKQWFKNFTKRLSTKNPYCSICCVDTSTVKLSKSCGKHTMCIFRNGKHGPGCKGFLDIPLTEDEIHVIVDAHNTIRNKVALGLEERGNLGPQPPASNMRVLEWNGDLAVIAHRWAAQCTFAHDVCRDTPKFPVGQNIARGNFATSNEISFIIDWFDYVQYIGRDDIASFQYPLTSPLRYYTQLVWADTYQIGCARVVFQQILERGNTTYTEHFICNYGPIGNIPTQPIYRVGEPCTNCPEGTGCAVNYPGLCGVEIDFGLISKLETLRKIKKKADVHAIGLLISTTTKLVPVRCFYCIIFIKLFYIIL